MLQVLLQKRGLLDGSTAGYMARQLNSVAGDRQRQPMVSLNDSVSLSSKLDISDLEANNLAADTRCNVQHLQDADTDTLWEAAEEPGTQVLSSIVLAAVPGRFIC